MESAGELSAADKLTQNSSSGDKLVRPQTAKTGKAKPVPHADDLKIITIDQLQTERLKGEYHA